jgi:hypothetical protein
VGIRASGIGRVHVQLFCRVSDIRPMRALALAADAVVAAADIAILEMPAQIERCAISGTLRAMFAGVTSLLNVRPGSMRQSHSLNVWLPLVARGRDSHSNRRDHRRHLDGAGRRSTSGWWLRACAKRYRPEGAVFKFHDPNAENQILDAGVITLTFGMAWYSDNRKLTHTQAYSDRAAATKEARNAARYGWQIDQEVSPQGAMNDALWVAGGPMGQLFAGDHQTGEIVVTFVRQEDWAPDKKVN